MTDSLTIIKGRNRVKDTNEIIYPETSDDQVVIEGTDKTLRNCLGQFLVGKKEPTDTDRSGYILFSSGYIEQWGEQGSWSGNIDITITLPRELRDTYYNVSYIGMGNSKSANCTIRLASRTTKNFVLSTYSDSKNGILWNVKGFINPYEYYYGFERLACDYKSYSRRRIYYAWYNATVGTTIYTYTTEDTTSPKVYNYTSGEMVIEDTATTGNSYVLGAEKLVQSNATAGTSYTFNRKEEEDVTLGDITYFTEKKNTDDGTYDLFTLTQIKNLEESTLEGTLTSGIFYVGTDGQEYLLNATGDYKEKRTEFYVYSTYENKTFVSGETADLYEKTDPYPTKKGVITMLNNVNFMYNGLKYKRNALLDFSCKQKEFR